MIEIRNDTDKPIYIKVVHTKLGNNYYVYIVKKGDDKWEKCEPNYYLQPEVEESLA